jgi:enediyne core biosynthesis thioesterase
VREEVRVKAFVYPLVVSFQDTNLVGNVYFSQYFTWQGKCREAFLREYAPRVLEDFRAGFGMVTKESECRFMREAFAFDQLEVEMFLDGLSPVGIGMRFDYYRQEADGRVLLAQGSQSVAWVSPDHHITLMPDYLYQAVRVFAADPGEGVASEVTLDGGEACPAS